MVLIQPRYQSSNLERQRELDLVRQRNADLFLNLKTPEERQFAKLFEFAEEGKINIIANADISFDETIRRAASLGPNECFALSRYDLNGSLFDTPYSQDTWIFRGKPNLSPGFANFSMGVPGCDNRLLWELQESGYVLSNPSRTIKTWHHHDSSYRSYVLENIQPIPPPYALLAPHELGAKNLKMEIVEEGAELGEHFDFEHFGGLLYFADENFLELN